MSDNSHIEWTEATWNPVTGCTKVSQGCKHCYAERDWKRLSANPTAKAYFGRKFTDVQCHPERLDQPLRWTKPRRIFVNSMSDLFHPDVPDNFIDRVLAVMALAPQHTFQVLTKRPERMRAYFLNDFRWAGIEGAAQKLYSERNGGADPSLWLAVHGPLPNVWLGTSVEDQATAGERIPPLLETPAAVRFLSCEPLLGPVDLEDLDGGAADIPREYWIEDFDTSDSPPALGINALTGERWQRFGEWSDLGTRVDWIIAGGESGPRARPFVLGWGKDIVRQCRAAGTPVFVKQIGSNPTNREGDPHPIKDRKGGDMNEWPEELRVREVPA